MSDLNKLSDLSRLITNIECWTTKRDDGRSKSHIEQAYELIELLTDALDHLMEYEDRLWKERDE